MAFTQLKPFLSNNLKNAQMLLVLHTQQDHFDDEDGEKYYIFIMLTMCVLNGDGFVIS